MNYKPDYHRQSLNPLQNYYTNCPVDPKAAQIKKYFRQHAGSRAQTTCP